MIVLEVIFWYLLYFSLGKNKLLSLYKLISMSRYQSNDSLWQLNRQIEITINTKQKIDCKIIFNQDARRKSRRNLIMIFP